MVDVEQCRRWWSHDKCTHYIYGRVETPCGVNRIFFYKPLGYVWRLNICKWFEARRISTLLSVIVRVSVVLKRTVVVDIDWRFDNVSGSNLVDRQLIVYICLIVAVIDQFSHDVLGCWDSSQWLVHFDPCVASVISVVCRIVSQICRQQLWNKTLISQRRQFRKRKQRIISLWICVTSNICLKGINTVNISSYWLVRFGNIIKSVTLPK